MDLNQFEKYKMWDVLDIYWERGNGELNRKYIYLGNDLFDNDAPILADSEKLNAKPKKFFDASNPEININRIEKMGSYQISIKPKTLLEIFAILSGRQNKFR